MPRSLPEWAERALTMRKGECQVFKTDRRQDSIVRSLEAAGLTDYKLRRATKPHFWFVCKGDWPESFYAKRALTDRQKEALAMGRLKAKP